MTMVFVGTLLYAEYPSKCVLLNVGIVLVKSCSGAAYPAYGYTPAYYWAFLRVYCILIVYYNSFALGGFTAASNSFSSGVNSRSPVNEPITFLVINLGKSDWYAWRPAAVVESPVNSLIRFTVSALS